MRTWMWLVVAGIVIFGGILLFQNYQTVVQPGPTGVGGGPGILPDPKRMEIQLNPVEGEEISQSGRAVFEERDDRVIVTVNVDKVEGLNNQPAHIHLGSCPGVGEIVFPLNNVVDGRSVTEINTTIDQLQDVENPLALNVHKSVEETSIYTACGELPQ